MKEQQAPQYRIGAVSRITGIPPVTIRMWERRYEVTQPERTPAGDRLYNDNDIERLSMLKRAVDSGNSISNAAKLSARQLEQLTNQTLSVEIEDSPVTVAVLGEVIPETLNSSLPAAGGIELIGHDGQLTGLQQKLSNQATPRKVDVLIVELPTLDDRSHALVSDYRQKIGARFALVVYQFSTQANADRLNLATSQAVRAPLTPQQIALSCTALTKHSPTLPPAAQSLEYALKQPLPAQRFNEKELAQLRKLATNRSCECPAHLSDIVRSLQAFEQYSANCESQSSDDAAMHSMLHHITAQARKLMEDALQAFVSHEQQ